jgi:hypothetical protein
MELRAYLLPAGGYQHIPLHVEDGGYKTGQFRKNLTEGLELIYIYKIMEGGFHFSSPDRHRRLRLLL